MRFPTRFGNRTRTDNIVHRPRAAVGPGLCAGGRPHTLPVIGAFGPSSDRCWCLRQFILCVQSEDWNVLLIGRSEFMSWERLTSLTLTVLLCAACARGQTVVVSGNVVDTVGDPIAGVTVSLATSGAVDYTDTAGAFALQGTDTRLNPSPETRTAHPRIGIRGNTLTLALTRAAHVSVRVYDLAGRTKAALARRYTAGHHELTLGQHMGDGVYLLDVRVGGERASRAFTRVDHDGACLELALPTSSGRASLGRRAAVVDSLIVRKPGYRTVRLGVESFPSTFADIVLHADAIEWRVDSLLSLMTTDEKTGQMIQADFDAVVDSGHVRDLLLGSVIAPVATDRSRLASDWADRSDAVQNDAAQTRLGIPVLQGTDAVHGHNNCKDAVIFPHNIGLGCIQDSSLVAQAWAITAREAAGTGSNWTFGPCIAVARDERWGRTYEGFGETAELAEVMGVAATRGLQGAGTFADGAIAACAKHYIADGGTVWGTGRNGLIDRGVAQGGELLLREVHLPGYVAAVRAGLHSVMISYSSWERPDTTHNEDMHGSYFWITEVLKGEFGFDGIVLTDCGGYGTISMHAAVADTLRERVKIAANAGIDMYMACDNYKPVLERLRSLVSSGEVPMSRIDDAVRRILRVKYRLGLFENALVDRSLTGAIGSASHRAVARDCARQSCVLLKNEGGALPLSKQGQKIAVVGFHADSIALQCGGWSMGWHVMTESTAGTTILEGMQAAMANPDDIILSTNGTGIDQADVAVIVTGERTYAEWTGDNANPNLPIWTRTMIDNCYNAGKPVVLVLLSGRPLVFEGYDAKCDAILAAWLPGTEGNGVSDVLFGDYAPTGKLSHSWPRAVSQIPINVGDAGYDPLYDYGFGLTY
ncbi:MAG: hypothetical protein GF331_20210 [Chitinivibrionales bacterium]|nr:hypothetical protein [Chitinivibrionales bacterium]